MQLSRVYNTIYMINYLLFVLKYMKTSIVHISIAKNGCNTGSVLHPSIKHPSIKHAK